MLLFYFKYVPSNSCNWEENHLYVNIFSTSIQSCEPIYDSLWTFDDLLFIPFQIFLLGRRSHEANVLLSSKLN